MSLYTLFILNTSIILAPFRGAFHSGTSEDEWKHFISSFIYLNGRTNPLRQWVSK